MIVHLTIEKVVGILTGIAFLITWALAITKSKFVTRKEWHDSNNAISTTLGDLQSTIATVQSRLEAGDSRMSSLDAHIQAVDQSSRSACEGIARIEGILLGQESPKRKAGRC